jgi:hypothetical protein
MPERPPARRAAFPGRNPGRETRPSGSRWLTAAAALGILGAIGSAYALSEAAAWLRLRTTGMETTAAVTACVFNPADERSDSFDLTYSYAVPDDPRTFAGTTTAHWRVAIGSPLRIVYASTRPSLSRPADALGIGAIAGPVALLALCLPFAVAGLVLVAVTLTRRMRTAGGGAGG